MKNRLKSKILMYVIIGSSVGFHLLAISLWFAVTQATFSWDDCEEVGNSEEEAVCATHGPILSLIIVILYGMAAALYVIVTRPIHELIKTDENNFNEDQ